MKKANKIYQERLRKNDFVKRLRDKFTITTLHFIPETTRFAIEQKILSVTSGDPKELAKTIFYSVLLAKYEDCSYIFGTESPEKINEYAKSILKELYYYELGNKKPNKDMLQYYDAVGWEITKLR